MWKLPSGLIAIDAEIFSLEFSDTIYNVSWPSLTCSFAIHGGAANQATVLAVKDWKTLSSVRTGGRWDGLVMPEALFRWEQSWPFAGGPELKNITFMGTGVPGQDPIGLWMSEINNGVWENVTVYGVRIHGHFFERIENTKGSNVKFLFCGYQPTKAGGDGFIPAEPRFNAAGTTLSVASGAFSFTADHVGKWVWIAGAGRNGGSFVGQIASRTNSATVVLAAPVITNVTGKCLSFEPITGSVSIGSPYTLTLDTDAPGAMWYPGQMVLIPFARDSEDQQVQINIIEAKVSTTITLRYPVQASTTSVPIIIGMQGVWGRFDDGPTAGNNDVFLHRITYECAHIAPYGAGFGVLFQNCNQLYFAGKIHGKSPDFNNFGGAGATAIFDNVQGNAMFAAGVEFDWGFSREYGNLWVVGDENMVDLTGTTLGMFVEPNVSSLVYWAPKTARKSGLVWSNSNLSDAWPVDGQANFKFGQAGSLLGIEELRRDYRLGQGFVSKAIPWTPEISFATPGTFAPASYNSRSGCWYRIGDIVHWTFTVDFSTGPSFG